jgi:DNA helicase-2/ATP-dependent DNA helicase PcrA
MPVSDVPLSIVHAAQYRVENKAGFRIGQGVRHAKFGEGTLIAIEGSGNEARAQVHFGQHGSKWLALNVAKLEVIVG